MMTNIFFSPNHSVNQNKKKKENLPQLLNKKKKFFFNRRVEISGTLNFRENNLKII